MLPFRDGGKHGRGGDGESESHRRFSRPLTTTNNTGDQVGSTRNSWSLHYRHRQSFVFEVKPDAAKGL